MEQEKMLPPMEKEEIRKFKKKYAKDVYSKMSMFGKPDPKWPAMLDDIIVNGYALGLFGGVGTGKTFFFEVYSNYCRQRIEIWSMMKFSQWSCDELDRWLGNLHAIDIVLDDIGSEVTSNNYGSKYDYLPIIVENRLSAPGRTHFTTNLDEETIKQRYGARVADRLKTLAKFYELNHGVDGDGGSFRNEPRCYNPTFSKQRLESWQDCRRYCKHGTGFSCLVGWEYPRNRKAYRSAPWECPNFAPTQEGSQMQLQATGK